VSLLTALNLHGMIEQIPSTIYAVSLGRTERIDTRQGRFSFHHVVPEVFGGFEETETGVLLASPEKALFDVAYLFAGRSRLFRSLPELELPPRFRKRELGRWTSLVPSKRGRTLVATSLARLLRSR
jgi:hypothetical protein